MSSKAIEQGTLFRQFTRHWQWVTVDDEFTKALRLTPSTANMFISENHLGVFKVIVTISY